MSTSQVDADLELAAAHALCRQPPVERGHVVVAQAHVDAARVGAHPPRRRAQRLPHGLAVQLRLQVPERHVEAANRPVRRALVAALERGVHHPLPQSPDAPGVPAHDQGRHRPDGRPAPWRADCDAGDALVGVDEHGEAGRRVEAVGRVRVAERPRQLHHVRSRPDAGDLHGSTPREGANKVAGIVSNGASVQYQLAVSTPYSLTATPHGPDYRARARLSTFEGITMAPTSVIPAQSLPSRRRGREPIYAMVRHHDTGSSPSRTPARSGEESRAHPNPPPPGSAPYLSTITP